MLQKGVFVTTSNFLIPLVLQPNGGHLIFFDLLIVSSFQWSQYGLIKSEQLQIELNFVVTISFQQKMYSSVSGRHKNKIHSEQRLFAYVTPRNCSTLFVNNNTSRVSIFPEKISILEME